jgi:hypothetical protein
MDDPVGFDKWRRAVLTAPPVIPAQAGIQASPLPMARTTPT